MKFFRNIFTNRVVDDLEQRILSGEEFSFRQHAWKQFKKNRISIWALRFLFFLVLLALLAPVLSNDKPLYCVYKGETLFPVFTTKTQYEIKTSNGETEKIDVENGEWRTREYESVWWPLLSVYAPGKTDRDNFGEIGPSGDQYFTDAKGNTGPAPLRFRHWLGVSKDGSDVLAGLLHGIKYSLLIGIFSYLISSLLGITLGAMAGYFGNDTLVTTTGNFFVTMIGLIFAWFYGIILRWNSITDAFGISGLQVALQLFISIGIITAVIFIFNRIGRYAGRIKILSKPVTIPVDSIISRCIETMNSMPLFVLIVSIGAIAVPSFFTLILIIGFTSWTPIARLTRAELLRIKALDYIQAGKSFGFSHTRIIFRHALPNALGPALVAIAFGIAGCILTESSLSFIGVGVPPDVVTWGKLISSAKESVSSWWLVIFPGTAIFLTVLMYNLIGEGLRDALDPKLRQ